MQASQLYAEVTNQIVDALEKGGLPPWRKPWSGSDGGFLPLRHAGQPYRGINLLILMIQADAMGYGSPYWFTFKQALEYKAGVRKGEKSTAILWCEPRTKTVTADDGTEGEDRFWISKVYRVFNASQCDGLPERYNTKAAHTLDPAQRLENADTFIKNTGATIRHGSGGAYYRPSEDVINLPPFEAFTSPEGYAATALHEAGHWSGHSSRLARNLKPFTNRQAYAEEEIRVELASVMVAAQLGINPPSLEEHAAYIQFWIAAMKENPRFLFTAASQAQRIADYLNSLQPKPE